MREAHLRRWQVALAFSLNVIAIVVVTILLTHSIRQNGEAIRDLRHTKAAISDLQKTNCDLKAFFLGKGDVDLAMKIKCPISP